MPQPSKTRLQDLAIFGGPSLFDHMMRVGRPSVIDQEAVFSRMRDAVERRWLSNDGPLLLEMEQAFADFLGVRHCIAVTNATLGLQLTLHELGIQGPVLMPALTFIGTAHAAMWQGMEPVFCDVLADRHTLDPAAVEAAMSPDIKAILAVHLWGRPCEIDALQEIADRWSVPLIFDAAHAMGSSYKGRKIGGFGRAEVFSLHATKGIHALEGGLITTADDSLAQKLRAARNYGFIGEDQVAGLGINAKMTEFSAAMGLANLQSYETLRSHNRALDGAYRSSLSDLPDVSMAQFDDAGQSHHYAVLEVAERDGFDRDSLLAVLYAENIHARRYFWPGCHRSPPYVSRPLPPHLPVTDQLSVRLLQLPTGMQLDPAQAHAIGSLIRFCMGNAGDVATALARSGALDA